MKKFFSTLIAVLMAAMLVFVAACGEGGNGGGTVEYTISVRTQGGAPVSGVAVSVSRDDSVVDIVTTGADGNVVLQLEPAEYEVEVERGLLRPGYAPARSYYLTRPEASTVNIVLNTAIIEGSAPANTHYATGDVMYDFTFNEVETGEEVTLSELLPEGSNKMVLINFFFDGCTYCEVEFPAMKTAYAKYEDSVEVVCIDPIDTAAAALSYKKSRDLPFNVVAETTLRDCFGVSGYPTNVIVDRYGVICMIDSGGITDDAIFEQWFEKYTAPDYEQDIGNEFELAVPDIPNPPVEDIYNALHGESDMDFTYSWDTTSIYNWPFVVNEEDGGIMSSNAGHMSSWSIVTANFTAEAGQVLAFDYKTSSELDGDYFYVILDGEPIFEASGRMDDWDTLYFYVGSSVSEEEHTLVLTYMKNFSGDVGDDAVYIRNMRITDEDELVANNETVTVCRQAATVLNDSAADPDNYYYENYITPVFNEEDGYYHVGTAEGPVLFAELRDDTRFGFGITDMAYDAVNNPSISPASPEYVFYENNDTINKYAFYEASLIEYDMTPVTQELKDLLVEIVAAVGNPDVEDEKEWLEICRYYDEYGVPGEPMGDLLLGVSLEYTVDFSDIVSGYTVEAVPKSPRGVFFSFTPERDGTYLVSTSNIQLSVTGHKATAIWMLDYIPGDEEYGNVLNPHYTEDHYVDGNGPDGNAQLIASNLIAGTTYYFSAALSDPNMMGTFDINIAEYNESYVIRPITSDAYVGDTETGEIWLPKFVDVSLNEDGYYYASSLDGLTQHGRILMSFTTSTIVFMVTDFEADRLVEVSVSVEQMIENGLFDLTETGYYKKFYDYAEQNYNESLQSFIESGGTREEFIAANGEFYNAYEEVLTDEERIMDYTSVMQEYLKGINNLGYSYVDAQLADIFKIITRMNGELTDDAWLRLCVYREALN